MSRKTSALKRPPRATRLAAAIGVPIALLMATPAAIAAKPVDPVCSITGVVFPTPADDATADPACDSDVCVFVGGDVEYTGTVTEGSPPYTTTWQFGGGNPFELSGSIAASGGTDTQSTTYNAEGAYSTDFSARDSSGKNGRSCSGDSRTVRVINPVAPPTGTSINSTSANGPLASPVTEQTFASTAGFTVIGINDLGMHCADLDNRVMAILPPFNVVHASVIQKGTGDTPATLPQILDDTQVEVVYSAASNNLDPVLDPLNPPAQSILGNSDVYKTNFWDANPLGTGNSLAFDMYDVFYPDGLLDGFGYDVPGAAVDQGLPVPDLASDPLEIHQQDMPGVAAPYTDNVPQDFTRFDTTLPFFNTFPFGYILTDMNWFAADGIPISYADDEGRENAYPLMRVQAKAAVGNTLGIVAGTTLASVDTVLPVAIEADCKNCHVSASAGLTGNRAIGGVAVIAACIGGAGDPDCPAAFEGSPRDCTVGVNGCILIPGAGGDTGTPFTVADPTDDPDLNTTTLMSEEWAADTNIVRLHDAKHGTSLEANTPIACQSCHYTPALDLLQTGPREEVGRLTQSAHKSFSNVMHQHHGTFADLFPIMPEPNTVPTADRLDVLDKTCYGCHPGRRTQCLRGAMFQGDILCQDCHGEMAQVGNDFTDPFPATPGVPDLTKRVPWAMEPMCQSCHVGDAVNQPADQNGFIYAADGIRLLRAWRTGDADAKPIEEADSRFAEDKDAATGNNVLYRLSKGGDTVTPGSGAAFKKGHGGVFCEACHGSTHAVWPVTPRSGPFVANDNATATQLQGHDGKIQECDVCHERDANGDLTMPLGLDGPHGIHPVNDERWNLNHKNFTGGQFANCKTCHGQDLTGTVLSQTSAARVLLCKNNKGDLPECTAGNPTANVPAGTPIGCGNCHRQK